MHPTVRAVLSVVAGLAIGLVLINVGLAFSPYQAPSGVDYNDAAAYALWRQSLPDVAFVIVLAIYLFASFVGGFVSARMVPTMAYAVSFSTGFALLFYGIVTYLAFSNPAWMTYCTCVGCAVFGLLGGWLAKRTAQK